jgi:hypothetical protein
VHPDDGPGRQRGPTENSSKSSKIRRSRPRWGEKGMCAGGSRGGVERGEDGYVCVVYSGEKGSVDVSLANFSI